MRIFIDSAELADVIHYDADPWISGFTTNATLVKRAGADVEKLVAATDKEVSVEAFSCTWQPNVRWKVTHWNGPYSEGLWNLTAVCSPQQVPRSLPADAIVSVFAGRIMDTGRSPEHVLTLARLSGAQVLWASPRSVYDITLADQHRCDIITVTPAIYEKWREWHGKPLELVAAETIAQFERDR